VSDASRIRFDPFEALGLEPRFDLEAASIDAAWMRRLRAAHPDRAGGGAEHSEIARSAATLNEARAILRDPLRRGEALLARCGDGGGDPAALPPSFLPEMLELRERLEEAIDAGEEAGLLELAEEIDGRRSSVLTRLATLFAEPRAAPISNATRLELNVLRYLDRVREELRQAPRGRS
jgi:DnaJ-domain-containing protein 1